MVKATAGMLRPAFASRRAALCFLSLVAAILLLPAIISWSGMIHRRQSYEIMTSNHGAYSFVAHEIFDNNGDIDLLFLGSSVLFAGVDTPQVQRELSAQLGRPARVLTFGHYFNSADVLYMELRDTLERKRIRMVILSIPRMPYSDGPSTTGCRFLRHTEAWEIFDQVPLKYKAAMYACTLLRAPRDILSIIRQNPSSISPTPFAKDLGADKAEIGLGRDPRTFTRFTPTSPSIAGEQMIYSPETRENFSFRDHEIPFYQGLFLEKIAQLCRQKQVPLAILNIPQPTERNSNRVIERTTDFVLDVPLIGVPPATLFAGLNGEEIDQLRFDDAHFNANGSEFFTRTVMPAILEVYTAHGTKDP